MVMKGLPESFNNFITVVTQSSKECTFVEFKSAIRNYSENEKSRCVTIRNSSNGKDTIMKVSGANKHERNIVPRCYGCRKEGHFARACPTLYCTPGLAKFDWKVVAHWATKYNNLVAQQ